MKNKDLVAVINSCGYGSLSSLSSRQRRSQYIERISHSLSELACRSFRYIISIDVGLKNLAYVTYDCESEFIFKWRLVNLECSGTDLPELSRSVRKAFAEMIDQLPINQVFFVIEKQPRRGLIPIAAQFHALAYASEELTTAVMTAFKASQIPDAVPRSTKYMDRKKDAVRMVSDWLDGDIKSLPRRLFLSFEDVISFHQLQKKDDMADCLLQLLAFVQFIEQRKKWIKNFVQ